MALTFPRDMTTAVRWSAAEFRLQRRQETSRTKGGSHVVADLGPALWRASFRAFPRKRNAAEALLADFETLGGALRTFLAHPAKRPIPGAYGDVSGFDLSGLTIGTIAADRSALSLAGVPNGFQLTAGDFLSITTAAGGREFVRLAESGAGTAGQTDVLACFPALRPSVVVGRPVSIVRPLCEMQLEPGSLALEDAGAPWKSLTFNAWQVIR